MFSATGSVNTHKGAIFTLGLLCAGAGMASRSSCTIRTGAVLARCCEMAAAPLQAEPDAGGSRVVFENLSVADGCGYE